jgi:hypothetical protein
MVAGLLAASTLALATDAAAPPEKLYPQAAPQVFDAVVSTFRHLSIPVTAQTPESGTVAGEVVSGASLFMKVTFVTAKATPVEGGTRVTYSREAMRSVKATRVPADDPKATAEFFAALDAELKSRGL